MLCGLAVVMAGCTTYYRVSDPAGTKEYYTTKIKESKSGSITFTDKKSGSVVNLHSSEIKEISGDEFEAGIKGGKK